MIILLFLMWIIFNGKITLEIAIIGAIVTGVIFVFASKYLDYSLKKEIKVYRSLGLILQFLGILVVEIIKANLATMHFVLTEREVVEPVIVEFYCDFKTRTAKTLLADSITLTPGTITVSMEGNRYQIHCLDDTLAADIDKSIFVKKLKALDELWSEEK